MVKLTTQPKIEIKKERIKDILSSDIPRADDYVNELKSLFDEVTQFEKESSQLNLQAKRKEILAQKKAILVAALEDIKKLLKDNFKNSFVKTFFFSAESPNGLFYSFLLFLYAYLDPQEFRTYMKDFKDPVDSNGNTISVAFKDIGIFKNKIELVEQKSGYMSSHYQKLAFATLLNIENWPTFDDELIRRLNAYYILPEFAPRHISYGAMQAYLENKFLPRLRTTVENNPTNWNAVAAAYLFVYKATGRHDYIYELMTQVKADQIIDDDKLSAEIVKTISDAYSEVENNTISDIDPDSVIISNREVFLITCLDYTANFNNFDTDFKLVSRLKDKPASQKEYEEKLQKMAAKAIKNHQLLEAATALSLLEIELENIISHESLETSNYPLLIATRQEAIIKLRHQWLALLVEKTDDLDTLLKYLYNPYEANYQQQNYQIYIAPAEEKFFLEKLSGKFGNNNETRKLIEAKVTAAYLIKLNSTRKDYAAERARILKLAFEAFTSWLTDSAYYCVNDPNNFQFAIKHLALRAQLLDAHAELSNNESSSVLEQEKEDLTLTFKEFGERQLEFFAETEEKLSESQLKLLIEIIKSIAEFGKNNPSEELLFLADRYLAIIKKQLPNLVNNLNLCEYFLQLQKEMAEFVKKLPKNKFNEKIQGTINYCAKTMPTVHTLAIYHDLQSRIQKLPANDIVSRNILKTLGYTMRLPNENTRRLLSQLFLADICTMQAINDDILGKINHEYTFQKPFQNAKEISGINKDYPNSLAQCFPNHEATLNLFQKLSAGVSLTEKEEAIINSKEPNFESIFKDLCTNSGKDDPQALYVIGLLKNIKGLSAINENTIDKLANSTSIIKDFSAKIPQSFTTDNITNYSKNYCFYRAAIMDREINYIGKLAEAKLQLAANANVNNLTSLYDRIEATIFKEILAFSKEKNKNITSGKMDLIFSTTKIFDTYFNTALKHLYKGNTELYTFVQLLLGLTKLDLFEENLTLRHGLLLEVTNMLQKIEKAIQTNTKDPNPKWSLYKNLPGYSEAVLEFAKKTNELVFQVNNPRQEISAPSAPLDNIEESDSLLEPTNNIISTQEHDYVNFTNLTDQVAAHFSEQAILTKAEQTLKENKMKTTTANFSAPTLPKQPISDPLPISEKSVSTNNVNIQPNFSSTFATVATQLQSSPPIEKMIGPIAEASTSSINNLAQTNNKASQPTETVVKAHKESIPETLNATTPAQTIVNSNNISASKVKTTLLSEKVLADKQPSVEKPSNNNSTTPVKKKRAGPMLA